MIYLFECLRCEYICVYIHVSIINSQLDLIYIVKNGEEERGEANEISSFKPNE